ncbi:hypothetical protein GOV07_01700 [Candidatus Woesearchaeota archaeon]|nr:hypothetical protein [Candidatus Woesearchaeota archaeon]
MGAYEAATMQPSHEFTFSWPNEPLNALRKRSNTIGEELCSVVLGTHHLDLERLSAVITELGTALGLLYEQSYRINFNKESYQKGVFRAPKGRPVLDDIAVIHMDGSIHPPRHLRLMPQHWRDDKKAGVSNVEGYRDWAWTITSYTAPRPILINGYSIPFTEQGAIFIGLDLRLLNQWRDEVTNHHPNQPEWAVKPFIHVIPEPTTLYAERVQHVPLSERMLDPARPERKGRAYTRPAHLDQ